MARVRWSLTAIIILTLPAAALCQDWQYVGGKYGIHKAFIEETGNTPDGHAITTFSLACRPEKGKGAILMSYGVRNNEKISSFDFNYFHGPDAKAQLKQLFTLIIQTRQGTTSVRMRASGAYSDMDHEKDFQFEIGIASPRLILLMKSAHKIAVRVIDDRDKRKTLYTEFSTLGLQTSINELLKLGCK